MYCGILKSYILLFLYIVTILAYVRRLIGYLFAVLGQAYKSVCVGGLTKVLAHRPLVARYMKI